MRKAIKLLETLTDVSRFESYLKQNTNGGKIDHDCRYLFECWKANKQPNRLNSSDLKNRYSRLKTLIEDYIYYSQMQAEDGLRSYYLSRERLFNQSNSGQGIEEADLIKHIETLDAFYAKHKLESELMLKVNNFTYKQDGLQEAVETGKRNDLPRYHLNRGFLLGEKYYWKNKDKFDKMADTSDKRLFVFLVAYLMRIYNNGAKSLLNIVLKLFLRGIENKFVFAGKYLPVNYYQSIIVLANRIKPGLTRRLINEHTKHVAPSERKPSRQRALAQMAFADQEYSLVIELVGMMERIEPRYRLMELFCFYKENRMVELKHYARRLRGKIKRTKMRSKQKTDYLNTINILLRLGHTSDPSILYEMVSKNKSNYIQANWLINEIESKTSHIFNNHDEKF